MMVRCRRSELIELRPSQRATVTTADAERKEARLAPVEAHHLRSNPGPFKAVLRWSAFLIQRLSHLDRPVGLIAPLIIKATSLNHVLSRFTVVLSTVKP